ncbi:DNA methyltransferase [Marmoricola sp. Leaf446]|uniref:DUF1156 domain-containing protein n=1 Tax=Marmoricola sp. Leaf446 TaxID=1736379 RepID=UPI0006F2BF3C|nr:DUF1156 domain-containing protein [Marmoricola sp. Leaf446]KQT92055.1 DNA methyltransferase [Marmoricola sp. Leaf446]
MTRMIERWFPCSQVSQQSAKGWGSGVAEAALFTWFAKRPTAQAKAAIICSLLPWPDEESDQVRLQNLVAEAMKGRYAAWDALRAEILKTHPGGVSVLDPFSGRGMIPLEAARLGLQAHAIDYSPVAIIGSELLSDYIFRDWSGEPPLSFASTEINDQLDNTVPRLQLDVARFLREVGTRFSEEMDEFYPKISSEYPWAYLWAVSLPCVECGYRYPLYGNNVLQPGYWRGSERKGDRRLDPGQSFSIEADRASGTYSIRIHDGEARQAPTLSRVAGHGKAAVCPFCGHVSDLAACRAQANDGQGRDELLLVAEHDKTRGKVFRVVTNVELEAIAAARDALHKEKAFGSFLPAVPNEQIAPGNNNIIGPSIYGARTYGDLCNSRQTLSFVRLCRIHNEIYHELLLAGFSHDYAAALCSFGAAAMGRKIMRSTRGAQLQVYKDGRPTGINNIWLNETSLSFSFDYAEVGLAHGAGSWSEVASRTVKALANLLEGASRGRSVNVSRGSATALPMRDQSLTAVVTDPPYDEMIPYADASDLYFVWMRRALYAAKPAMAVSADPYGAQEKQEEIIVKRVRGLTKQTEFVEHRTREHYDARLTLAFSEMRRVVQGDGVVTIVFGHGEPEVWQRLLGSIESAGLVMTGSWPANTEAGGQQGKANIETTLTMACRPAPAGRPSGRKGAVEAEIKSVIEERYPDWERWGLAPADMLMAAAGPAMEAVGRYSEVLDAKGERVDIATFLPLARAAVQDAMAVEINHQPLETFDARTRFALWWVRLYGRQVQAKSELRWQALASSLDLDAVRDLVPDADKGVRFMYASKFQGKLTAESAVIDVALALAAASEDGLESMGEVMVAAKRHPEDSYLWAAIQFLADRLPDNDPDSVSYTRVLRTRTGISNAAETVAATNFQTSREQREDDLQLRLL